MHPVAIVCQQFLEHSGVNRIVIDDDYTAAVGHFFTFPG